VLIEALDEHEITVRELAAAIEPMSSESLWVAAMVMAERWDDFPDRMHRMWAARVLCRALANSHRNLN
jgi:hypothetical protein